MIVGRFISKCRQAIAAAEVKYLDTWNVFAECESKRDGFFQHRGFVSRPDMEVQSNWIQPMPAYDFQRLINILVPYAEAGMIAAARQFFHEPRAESWIDTDRDLGSGK
ncbi:hypothetical protein WS68_21335 [Burkholderia sp. TSV86]|nr:hypothetical protein WS68_21335 [Burkholderia sp. TSV86]